MRPQLSTTPGFIESMAPANPLCFLLNDFTPHKWYRGTFSLPPNPTVGGALTGNAVSPQPNPTLPPASNWNLHNSLLTADLAEGYLPLAKYMSFRTSVTLPAGGVHYPFRIKIQFIKFKNYHVQTSNHSYSLPTNLGAYRDLIVQPTLGNTTNLFERNSLNKYIHQVLYEKVINVTPNPRTHGFWPTGGGSTAAHPYTTNTSLKFTFPQKFLRTTLDPAYEQSEVWANIPQAQQIWCLISTDADIDIQQELRFSASLTENMYWRDSQGTMGI